MGFGLPAAIGAKVGNPKQDVVCSGDSSIQMSIQELGTIAQYRLGIRLLLLIMDGKEWYVNGKNPFMKNRFSNSYMKNGMPNFARVARAYGIEGWEVKR
jgi:acetolactate synthase-1/2/3 large subunit